MPGSPFLGLWCRLGNITSFPHSFSTAAEVRMPERCTHTRDTRGCVYVWVCLCARTCVDVCEGKQSVIGVYRRERKGEMGSESVRCRQSVLKTVFSERFVST